MPGPAVSSMCVNAGNAAWGGLHCYSLLSVSTEQMRSSWAVNLAPLINAKNSLIKKKERERLVF